MQNIFQFNHFECKIPNSFSLCISNAKLKIGIQKKLFQNKIPFDQIEKYFYILQIFITRNRIEIQRQGKWHDLMVIFIHPCAYQ